MTYQPKELGGVPQVVQRVSRCQGLLLRCESVTRGGADLLELWEEVEAKLQSETYAVVVLQLSSCYCTTPETVFAIEQALTQCYGPALLAQRAEVVLYQSLAEPMAAPSVDHMHALDTFRAALGALGLDVRVARAADAARLVREDQRAHPAVFPALFKDDMGHPSAFAGLLMGASIALCLSPAEPQRLERALEAMLPAFWRTASCSYAGGTSSKLWNDRGFMGDFVEEDEDERALAKYPPGTRTERKDLGVAPCEALVRAAVATSQADPSGQVPSADTAAQAAPAAPAQRRRWKQS